MKIRIASALLTLITLAAGAVAQDRVLLRPTPKAGEESRYTVNATVETTVSPKGSEGIAGTSRGELTATVLVRTLQVKDGEILRQAVVEAISFSANKAGIPDSASKEIAGRNIDYSMTPSGHLLNCSISNSPGYLTLADLLFSISTWYPAGEVSIGGSWESLGRGHLYTDRLSETSIAGSTVYKLASLSKGVASIDGTVTLSQKASPAFDPSGALKNAAVIANGKGTAHIDVDAATGRLISGTTEGRVEGRVISIQPTAAGEKLNPREGSFVETSKFLIKLVE